MPWKVPEVARFQDPSALELLFLQKKKNSKLKVILICSDFAQGRTLPRFSI